MLDATPQARLSGEKHAGMASDRFSTSGLGGVWAEENTREAIFAAMQRKETFGTSGVRIKVRFFGGWDFASATLQSKDWVKTGYATGVPMGGDLPTPKSKSSNVHRLGRQGSRRRQSRSHPDRQGVDAKRADLREDL